jgi:hypothetical protein
MSVREHQNDQNDQNVEKVEKQGGATEIGERATRFRAICRQL